MTALKPQDFPVGALNWKSLLSLIALAIAVLTSIILGIDDGGRLFPVVLAIAVFSVIILLLASAKVAVSDGVLIAGGGFYKVKVPMERLDIAHARLMSADDPFRLRWRTNGLGWPGLSLGWFTTNGAKRVFAVATGSANRVYVPTVDDFDIVVTPVDPAGFLEALRSSSTSL